MNKRKGSKFGVVAIIGVLVYFAYIFISQQKIIYSMNNEKRVLEAKIQEEQKLNEELKEQKEMLDTDQYIEKVAREKLGMVKKGERIFIDTNK